MVNKSGLTPDDLATRAIEALHAASRSGEKPQPRRVVLLLGADASAAARGEFTEAVRRALALEEALGSAAVVARRPRGLATSRVEIETRSVAVRVQARDRDLLGLLGIARYLSTAQIAALFFPARHISIPLRRLSLLASAAGGGYVRSDHYAGHERERIRVWSLTHAGYELAETAAALPMNYSTDPLRPQFLEHLIWLNELLVTLALACGPPVRPGALHFRWQCDTDHPFPFRTRAPDGSPAVGHVAPDAILEFPALRRRVFVEAEMGTHTIVPVSPSKTGATVMKLDRYAMFLGDFTDVQRRCTAYTDQFPDRFDPELVFMVRATTRRDRVREAIEERRRKDARPPTLAVKVLTLEDAKSEYGRLVQSSRAEPRLAAPAATRVAGAVELTPREVTTVRAAFNALLRNAKAARAAGIGRLTGEEVNAVSGAREVLARFDACDLGPVSG